MSRLPYHGLNMGSPHAIARLQKIIEYVARVEAATHDDIAAVVGVAPRTANVCVMYLCSIDRLAVVQRHNSNLSLKAKYGVGHASGPLPVAGEKTLSGAEAVQRRVDADQWPRGEHARRSGLVAALFPMAGA